MDCDDGCADILHVLVSLKAQNLIKLHTLICTCSTAQ